MKPSLTLPHASDSGLLKSVLSHKQFDNNLSAGTVPISYRATKNFRPPRSLQEKKGRWEEEKKLEAGRETSAMTGVLRVLKEHFRELREEKRLRGQLGHRSSGLNDAL